MEHRVDNFRVFGTQAEIDLWMAWYFSSTFPYGRIDRVTTCRFQPADKMDFGNEWGPDEGHAFYRPAAPEVWYLRGMPRHKTLYTINHESAHVPVDLLYLTWPMRAAIRALIEPAQGSRGWGEGLYATMPAEVYADRFGEVMSYPKLESPYDDNALFTATIPDRRVGRFLGLLITPPDYARLTARVTALQAQLAECQANTGDGDSTCEEEVARLTEELAACQTAGTAKDSEIARLQGGVGTLSGQADQMETLTAQMQATIAELEGGSP